ncbi:hypothetical protein SBA2_200012 [Acidobacteriia bacterium SbA2]|nr:hypothetical protein SBA2_200012 [Acidobacteriia bacterium SbA2]
MIQQEKPQTPESSKSALPASEPKLRSRSPLQLSVVAVSLPRHMPASLLEFNISRFNTC